MARTKMGVIDGESIDDKNINLQIKNTKTCFSLL